MSELTFPDNNPPIKIPTSNRLIALIFLLLGLLALVEEKFLLGPVALIARCIGYFAILNAILVVIWKSINNRPKKTTEKITDEQVNEQPRYKANNWIALIYIVVLAVVIFNKIPGLAGIFFWVALGMGLIASIDFINRTFHYIKKAQNPLAKAFFSLFMAGGTIIVFLIGLIGGAMGYFSNHPIHGD